MNNVSIEKKDEKFILKPFGIEADNISISFSKDKIKILIENHVDKYLTTKSRVHLFEVDNDNVKYSKSKSLEEDEGLPDMIELRNLGKSDIFLTQYGHRAQLIKLRPYTVKDLEAEKELQVSPDTMVYDISDIKELDDNIVESIDLPKDKKLEKLEEYKHHGYISYKEVQKGTIGKDAKTDKKVRLIKMRPYMVRDLENNKKWKINSTEDLILPENPNLEFKSYKEYSIGAEGVDQKTNRKVKLIRKRPYTVKDLEDNTEFKVNSLEDRLAKED